MNAIWIDQSAYLKAGQWELIPLRREDMYKIKDWRNEQIRYLRQSSPLTDSDQEKYYDEVVQPSLQSEFPKQILFSFLNNHNLIGYGGLVHIEWEHRRAEVSFLLDTKLSGDNLAYSESMSRFLALIKEFAFKKIGLNRLYTETFELRPWHVKVLEQNGFELEGVLRGHVHIEGSYINSLIHGILNNERR